MKEKKTFKEKLDEWLGKVPIIMSSKISIFIFLFLFFYLFIFAILCVALPMLKDKMPTDTIQLILGNYTNVLSALGASIAAGAGTVVNRSVDKMHKKHDILKDTIDKLHEKVDRIEGKLHHANLNNNANTTATIDTTSDSEANL